MKKLSLLSAAEIFGVARETLRRELRRAGLEIGPGRTYTVRQVHVALAGDAKAARARLLTSQANLSEIEERKAAGELVTMDEARQAMASVFGPLRAQLLGMASTICIRANPSDPELARKVIDAAVHDALTVAQRAAPVAKARRRKEQPE